MIECDYVILCEKAIINQETNNLTMVETVESVHSNVFPFAHRNMTVVALFVSDQPVEHDCDIHLEFYMNDNLLAKIGGPVSFGNRKRSRLIAHLQTLPIPDVGILECKVRLNDGGQGEGEIVGVQRIEIIDLRETVSGNNEDANN